MFLIGYRAGKVLGLGLRLGQMAELSTMLVVFFMHVANNYFEILSNSAFSPCII